MTISIDKIAVASSISDDLYMITLTAIELEYLRQCMNIASETNMTMTRESVHEFACKCAGIINDALVLNGD